MSVHSPTDPSAATQVTVEPEISMPMSVAPGDSAVASEDATGGVTTAVGPVGDILILDPSTMTLHPVPPTLSYVIDGKKVCVCVCVCVCLVYAVGRMFGTKPVLNHRPTLYR